LVSRTNRSAESVAANKRLEHGKNGNTVPKTDARIAENAKKGGK